MFFTFLNSIGNIASIRSIKLLEWFETNLSIYTSRSYAGIAFSAVECGNIRILQWLIDRGFQIIPSIYIHALKYGHLNVIKWLTNDNINYRDIYRYASSNGHLETIKWAYGKDRFSLPWRLVLTQAIYGGDKKIFDWILKTYSVIILNTPNYWSDNISTSLGEKFDVDTLERLDKLGVHLYYTEIVNGALESGNFSVIEWIIKNHLSDIVITPASFCSAAKYGDVKTLQWVRENISQPFYIPAKALVIAAGKKRLSVFKWLIDNGAPVTDESLISAADASNLHILLFVYKRYRSLFVQYEEYIFDVLTPVEKIKLCNYL